MISVTLATYSMRTRFELALYGECETYLRSVGEEAVAEIELAASMLSRFDPKSDISAVNRSAGIDWVKVDRRVFNLVSQCADLSSVLGRSFDICIAPLMSAWGFYGVGQVPAETDLADALRVSGMPHLLLDADGSRVRLGLPGMGLDLGAVGKGYAIDRAVAVLQENGVQSALIHGGTSSAYAIGCPPDRSAWRISVPDPLDRESIWRTVDLKDCAMSVSATHGKSFAGKDAEYGHILDPKTGMSIAGPCIAVATGPDSVFCEAISTAGIVLGDYAERTISGRFPGYEVALSFGHRSVGATGRL